MKVVTLLENDTINSELKSAHGLSLYIEHKDKKILFDLGPGNQYITNAKKLGIDLKDIDICVISHAHNDHGRGIGQFLRMNKTAKVYISDIAFKTKPFKVKNRVYLPIGIQTPLRKRRIQFVKTDIEVAPGVIVHTDIIRQDRLTMDDNLLIKENGRYIPDPFDHEIYLSIHDEKMNVLFSGCSHKGIENIVKQLEERKNMNFTTLIGGFHFSHYDSGNLKQSMYLQEVSELFRDNHITNYYTGHCTGDEAYIEMKGILKESLQRFKTGTIINL